MAEKESMCRTALILGIAFVLASCQSKAEQHHKKLVEYAAYTAESCRHANQNILMVENMRSTMNKPQEDEDGRSFAKTLCGEAAKAAAALAEPQVRESADNF